MKRWLAVGISVVALLIVAPKIGMAGSLADLSAAVGTHYAAGDISDADVKAMLDDLVVKAQGAADPEAEVAYRSSFIDVVNAFNGAGISGSAASNLINLAQP